MIMVARSGPCDDFMKKNSHTLCSLFLFIYLKESAAFVQQPFKSSWLTYFYKLFLIYSKLIGINWVTSVAAVK